MGGGKLPPRQKMIGMMYLVLTALLAMNVSKDILDAFVLINEGLETTNENFEKKNELIYNAFEKAKMDDQIKVTPYWKKAQQAKALADELDLHIEALKQHLIRETDKKPPEVPDDSLRLSTTDSKDNYDIPTHILIGEPGQPKNGPNTGLELKEKVKLFREDLLNLIEKSETRASMKIGLKTDDFGYNDAGEFETWEVGWFYHIPLAAVITAMSKLQAEVRNAEGDIVKSLYSEISADAFKFDTVALKLIPESKTIFQGQDFKAQVIVAAYSTTVDPILLVGKTDSAGNIIGTSDSSGVHVERGVASYTRKAGSEGKVEWGGVLKIKGPDGSYKPFVFKDEYLVMKPALVVSADAVKVLYRGVDNPVSVSVGGVPPEKLKISISNGSFTGTKGILMVRPGQGKEAIVSVSAEIEPGKPAQRFGEEKFKVKNVPDPKAMFANSAGGNVPINQLKASKAVIAKLENFEFEGIKFEVVSYTMTALVKGNLVSKEAKSSALTPDMQTLVNALKGKQKLFIEDVKAKGPDGSVRSLGSIVIKVIG